MTGHATVRPLHVLTLNIHKGYTHFRRPNMLAELRDAMRAAGSGSRRLRQQP